MKIKNYRNLIIFILVLIFIIKYSGAWAFDTQENVNQPQTEKYKADSQKTNEYHADLSKVAKFPIKPVRLLIPFTPAGSNDVVARLLAQKLSETWRQQVVSDNRAGANGIIGTDMVAKAPADGYTLLMISTSFTMNPSLYKLPYDSLMDFSPISLIAEGPLVLSINPSFPANSIEQLIAYAKNKPGSIQYASSGLGGIAHLTGILFEKTADISLIHIPYKSSGSGVIDVIGGQVPLIFSSVSPALPFIKNGKLRALGIATLNRSALLPNVKTISEAGMLGFESSMWWGVLGPKNLPQSLMQKINQSVRNSIESQDIQYRFTSLGMDAKVSTPEDLNRLIRKDLRKWSNIISSSKIKMEVN